MYILYMYMEKAGKSMNDRQLAKDKNKKKIGKI